MAMYKYIRAAWKKPKDSLSELNKERLIAWRKEPTTLRLKRPTRIDRARSLGYRAKQGIIVVRQRVLKGGRMRENNQAGRRPKTQRMKKIVNKNYQQICEERVSKKYVNMEVLNSYKVAEDGKYYWYEVIIVDPYAPEILSDKQLKWIIGKRDRAGRGLTSAGRKSRGLNKKGLGAEKIRPSLRANKRRH